MGLAQARDRRHRGGRCRWRARQPAARAGAGSCRRRAVTATCLSPVSLPRPRMTSMPTSVRPLDLWRVVVVVGEHVAPGENRRPVDRAGRRRGDPWQRPSRDERSRPGAAAPCSACTPSTSTRRRPARASTRSGGAPAAAGRVVRGVLAGGPAADDDDVVGKKGGGGGGGGKKGGGGGKKAGSIGARGSARSDPSHVAGSDHGLGRDRRPRAWRGCCADGSAPC